MRIRCLAIIAGGALLSACTHDVTLVGSNTPASDVMANRKIGTPTLVSYLPDLQEARASASVGAHTWNICIGPGAVKTLRAVNEVAFTHAQEGEPQIRAPYNIRIDLDEVQGRLNVIPGFFQARADATIEISCKVDVTDNQGNEIARALIDGEGSDVDPDASTAFQVAGEKAIKKMASDYAYKIINTNVMR